MQVTIDILEEALSVLRTGPQEFAHEMHLTATVKWYELGKISQSKAAEMAGINCSEFVVNL